MNHFNLQDRVKLWDTFQNRFVEGTVVGFDRGANTYMVNGDDGWTRVAVDRCELIAAINVGEAFDNCECGSSAVGGPGHAYYCPADKNVY